MPDPGKPRDGWDKADIIGKIFSGVLLATIAVVVKCGADDIAASQHRGELVQSLIADLTTNDQRTRQDLALIALNHSVGEQNPRLVVDIAERLVVDTAGYAAGDRAGHHALSSVAFQVLRHRDTTRAESLKAQLERRFEDRVSADSVIRAALRSSPDTTARSIATPSGDSAVRAVSDLLAPLSSHVVFIQFQGDVHRRIIERLRTRFSEGGFTAPGVERITAPFSTAVRYFHAEDALLADSVARITRSFIQAEGLAIPALPIQDLSPRRFRAPRGQVEVWLSVR